MKAYKTAFVCGCLNGGTNGAFYPFLKKQNDLGLLSEGDLISHAKVAEADSLGRVYSSRVQPFNYGDGAGKTPVFSRCLFFSQGDEVDRIARKNYRQDRAQTAMGKRTPAP